MNVDKFGHHINKIGRINENGLTSKCSLKETSDGKLDANNKVIKNIKSPQDIGDSATKGYVDKLMTNGQRSITTLEELIKTLNKRVQYLENLDKNKCVKK